jgi:GxxExxY protein
LSVKENEIAREVVDAAFHIHSTMGPGLFESVYEVILDYELRHRGFTVERQVSVPITYEGILFDEGFRADIVVEDSVIIEIKSIEKLQVVHKKQFLTYLKLMDKKLGLLINFGEALIKHGIVRLVNGLQE